MDCKVPPVTKMYFVSIKRIYFMDCKVTKTIFLTPIASLSFNLYF